MTQDTLKDLFKEARKKVLWALAIFAGGYFLTFLGRILNLGRTPDWHEVPALLWTAFKAYLDLITDPFEYAAAHPLPAALVVAFASISMLLLFLFRRARQRVKEQGALIDDLAKYEALAIISGLKEWWPHAAKDNTGARWDVLRADIERPENNIVHVLGANGVDTFGGPDSPLHDTFTKFRGGSIRVILLAPKSIFTDGRADAVGARPTQYRKATETSERFLKELKKKHYAVDGRFYNGRPNWKLIITNRTCWMQYYAPGGPDVDKTPVYRFDATADGRGLYHYFCMEFERIWDRCDDHHMDL